MSVKEALELVDKVSGPAARMARAIGGVEKAMADYQKIATSGDQKQIERSFGKVATQVKRYQRELDKIEKSTKKTVQPARELGAPDALGAFGIGGAIGSGILTGAVALGGLLTLIKSAVTAATDLAVAFGKGLAEAHKLRSEGKALFSTLSGGRGDEVMDRLKTQSIATGQSMADLQEATKKARDEGLGFGDAFKLNLLRGDLLASGRSASDADAAIGKVIDKVKAGGNASKEIAKIAKQFNVAGTGANAAAKQANTLDGVLTRLKAAPGNILDALAKNLGPDLDKAAGAATKLINEFIKSGQAKAVVDGIASAVRAIGAGIEKAAPIAKAFWEGLKSGFGPVITELGKMGPLIEKFTGNKSAMDGFATAARAAGVAIGFMAGTIVRGVAAAAALIGIGASVIGKLKELGSSALSAGKSVIDGLVNGIKGGIEKAVAAARELADKVKGVLPKALQMHSPSKLFEGYGGNITDGLAKGIDGGVRDVKAAMGALGNITPANANAVPAGGGRAGAAGGGSVTIQINVTAAPGATHADGEALGAGIAAAMRREIPSFFEVRALEAAS